MAFLPMTQDVINFMDNSFDKENIVSYQMLLILFSKLFLNEEEFLSDPGDRMGLSHYIENFLRRNDFQAIITIKDLNKVFNSSEDYDIYDQDLYKIFFVLIYEELSSNDPQISFKIKESVFTLIDLLQNSIQEDELIDNNYNEFQNLEDNKDKNITIEEKNENIDFQIEENINLNNKNIFTPFVVHNRKYLKEYIQRKNLLPYNCAICGLSEWQNEPLGLELDSYNNVFSSTNINNLRFLCPNCFSQVGHCD